MGGVGCCSTKRWNLPNITIYICVFFLIKIKYCYLLLDKFYSKILFILFIKLFFFLTFYVFTVSHQHSNIKIPVAILHYRLHTYQHVVFTNLKHEFGKIIDLYFVILVKIQQLLNLISVFGLLMMYKTRMFISRVACKEVKAFLMGVNWRVLKF